MNPYLPPDTDPRIVGAVLNTCLFVLLKYAFGALGGACVALAFYEGRWSLYAVGVGLLAVSLGAWLWTWGSRR